MESLWRPIATVDSSQNIVTRLQSFSKLPRRSLTGHGQYQRSHSWFVTYKEYSRLRREEKSGSLRIRPSTVQLGPSILARPILVHEASMPFFITTFATNFAVTFPAHPLWLTSHFLQLLLILRFLLNWCRFLQLFIPNETLPKSWIMSMLELATPMPQPPLCVRLSGALLAENSRSTKWWSRASLTSMERKVSQPALWWPSWKKNAAPESCNARR